MALPTLEELRAWDRDDPLGHFRDRFLLPPGVIYLDGNSLGALPRQTAERQAAVVGTQWGERLIRSWKEGWLDAPLRIGGKIARIVGARPCEVAVADSTSVNLFKLMVAGLKLRPGRTAILTEAGNFPTDLHIATGVLECVPGAELRVVTAGEIMRALTPDIGLLVLTHVHYQSGFQHDMAALTQAAHEAGALVLWDLSHSVGAVKVDLDGCGADLAVGCGYKFLNGGPGAPAFLFAAERLHADLASPLRGWMGHADPFGFSDEWQPAPGMARFLCGTPPILSMAALESGIDLFLEADQAALFAKGARMFTLFKTLAAEWCAGTELTLLSPDAPKHRGSHIAFGHPEAAAIMESLESGQVIGDFRPPRTLRFGLTPLYTSFEDIWLAAAALAAAVHETERRQTGR